MGLLKEKGKHVWLVQLPGEGRSSFRERGGRDGDRSGRQRVGRVGVCRKDDGGGRAGVCNWICRFAFWDLASAEEVSSGRARVEDGPKRGWLVAQVSGRCEPWPPGGHRWQDSHFPMDARGSYRVIHASSRRVRLCGNLFPLLPAPGLLPAPDSPPVLRFPPKPVSKRSVLPRGRLTGEERLAGGSLILRTYL